MPGVMAFECLNTVSDFSPTERLTFICNDIIADECYSYVYDTDPLLQMINALPGTRFNEISHINGFDVTKNHSIIEISTKYLRDDTNYTIGVVCGTYTQEYNYSLGWTTGNAPIRGWVYLQDGLVLWVGTFFAVLILGSLIMWTYSKFKYKGGSE